jgi:hypothetical protein
MKISTGSCNKACSHQQHPHLLHRLQFLHLQYLHLLGPSMEALGCKRAGLQLLCLSQVLLGVLVP